MQSPGSGELHGPLWASLDVASLILTHPRSIEKYCTYGRWTGNDWDKDDIMFRCKLWVGPHLKNDASLSSRLEDSGSEHVRTMNTNHTKHVDKVFRGHFEEIPQSVHVMLSSHSNWLWRYNHLVQANCTAPCGLRLTWPHSSSLIRAALRNTVLTVGGLGMTGTKMTSCFVASCGWGHISKMMHLCQADWRILGQNMSELRTQIIQNMLIRFFGGILKRSRSLSM